MITTQLIGTIGKDAERREVNGKGVISFSVAVDQSYKNKSGEKVDKTLWVDVSVWAESMGLLNVLKRGAVVFVSGEPSARAYSTKDGEVKGSVSLRADNIKVCKYADDVAKVSESVTPEGTDGDLPF